jgi:hypothetical protein
MLKLQEKFTPTYELPQRAEERRREFRRDPATTGTRPGRRPAETFGLRDLRNLSIFGLVWGGYLWLHVAGAIKLFGRP